MERRAFLKSSSVLTGGLLTNQQTFAAEAGPLKVAIIGCGDRGKGIMYVLNDLPNLFKVTAVCDVLDFR